MHEYLTWLKNIFEFYRFFLSDVLGQNVLMAPDQNVSQGANCPNTPTLYTNSVVIKVSAGSTLSGFKQTYVNQIFDLLFF